VQLTKWLPSFHVQSFLELVYYNHSRWPTLGAFSVKGTPFLSSWVTSSLGFIIAVVIIVVIEAEVAERMPVVFLAMLKVNQQTVQGFVQ
jgi:hypothetical protein